MSFKSKYALINGAANGVGYAITTPLIKLCIECEIFIVGLLDIETLKSAVSTGMNQGSLR